MVKHPREVIEILNKNKSEIEILPTGFDKLDKHLDGGFIRKELIILGGKTGIGKSYFAGQIQYNLAVKGFRTAYFSLEISNEMVVSRLIGSLANLKPSRIMMAILEEFEEDFKIKAQAKIIAHEACLYFCDDVYEFEELKKCIVEGKYDFVIVDFIQNVEVERVSDEKVALKKVARDLQKLAKAQNLCIFTLSQLSNVVAREKAEKSPSVEFRGSGSIAHAGDLGFFIERGDPMPNKNPLSLFLKKNRRGPSDVTFDFEFQYPGGRITQAQ